MRSVPRFGDARVRRIGVLGGSFNPAHAGHRHVAEAAIRALGLDEVWLLVSPGNPLKPVAGMAPFPVRLRSAESIADGRRILAVGLEEAWRTRYTRDTLLLLRRRFRRARFVWLMGADILVQLPRWRRWEDVVRLAPFAVLPRPGSTMKALAGCAARRYRHARMPRGSGKLLVTKRRNPPAWVFLPGAEDPHSASAIRRRARGEEAITRLPPDDASWRKRRISRARRPGVSAALKAKAARASIAAAPPESVRKKAAVAGPKPVAGPRPAVAANKRAGASKPAESAAAAVSGKAPASRRRKAKEVTALDALQAVIVQSLADDKAEDLVTLDLVGRASFADRMVIATGLADRQIATMARHLEEKLKAMGFGRLAIEGRPGADWVLVDAGDIVVHLFKPEARAHYALERMWGAELGPEEQASAG
jgi:nicotinate-nucleotide adenylyltransferase